MMMTRRRSGPLAALILALGASASAAPPAPAPAQRASAPASPPMLQPASQPVSQAEVLLFETDHFGRVRAPATLVYAFRKTGNLEPGFDDTVRLDLVAANGAKKVDVHFLTGPRKHDIPALDDAHGNPVLLGFLERDILEMKRLTGGSTNYFRKRIRMALAEAAQVTREQITYGGQRLAAQVVRIQPYLNDPLAARFQTYVDKSYTFVLSEQVPGGVYQLRSTLGKPGAARAAGAEAAATGAGAPPVSDESLTLVKVAQPRP